jgi:hypothetical protein
MGWEKDSAEERRRERRERENKDFLRREEGKDPR